MPSGSAASSRVATLGDAVWSQPTGGPLVRAVRAPLRVILWASLRAGLRLRVDGRRHAGPAIVVSNHPHVIDGLVVLFADPVLRPIARWHRIPLARAGMWVADCIVTTTGTPVQPHRGAFADALAHVRSGGRVWVAPEGGWQPERTLRYPRTGAVRLSRATGAPMQVLGVLHERHPGPTLATWRPWHRPRIVLRWGPVLETTGRLDDDIDMMMRAIADVTGSEWRRPAPTRPSDRRH